jgi:hypothetical protein
MSTTTIGRVVGALYLLAFFLYGGGAALVNAGSGSTVVLSDVTQNHTQIAVGALLMLANSVLVAATGVLVYLVLRPHHELSALVCLIARTFEAVVCAVGVLFLLMLIPIGAEHADGRSGADSSLPALARVAQDGSHYAYEIAMISVAIGGLTFCRVLLRARLVPRFLAGWGLVGYAIFLTGAVLEILGFGVGLVLSGPGGLFEVALGLVLVVRGFPTAPGDDRPGLLTPSAG